MVFVRLFPVKIRKLNKSRKRFFLNTFKHLAIVIAGLGWSLSATASDYVDLLADLPIEDELVKAAVAWKPDNIRFLILTFDKNRSILITDKEIYKADSIELPKERINGVGFDDSIMAGFMMNILRSPDVIESFQFANSCGQATLFSKGLATKEHINSVYEKIKVEKIDL